MKKLILFMFLVVSALAVLAQKGRPVVFTGDTVQGNETIYITVYDDISSNTPLSITVLCSELGGETDGTMTLEGSVDGTNYVALTDVTGVLKGFPSDSLTMTDGAVQVWTIEKNFFDSYRVKVAGTASDTTLLSGYIFFPK